MRPGLKQTTTKISAGLGSDQAVLAEDMGLVPSIHTADGTLVPGNLTSFSGFQGHQVSTVVYIHGDKHSNSKMNE